MSSPTDVVSLHSRETTGSVAEACCKLIRERLGGLIVLRGLEELGAWFPNQGHAIDAAVDMNLMVALFSWIGTMDGAVVIAGGRLTHYGVVLPDPPKGKDLPVPGWAARHRAACWLSCFNDSVVVVVSEELGSITLLKGGQRVVVFERPKDEDASEAWFALSKDLEDRVAALCAGPAYGA